MKAWQIDAYGSHLGLPKSTGRFSSAGEVVVEVAGASVNPLDLKIQAGYMHDYFPVEFPYASARMLREPSWRLLMTRQGGTSTTRSLLVYTHPRGVR